MEKRTAIGWGIGVSTLAAGIAIGLYVRREPDQQKPISVVATQVIEPENEFSSIPEPLRPRLVPSLIRAQQYAEGPRKLTYNDVLEFGRLLNDKGGASPGSIELLDGFSELASNGRARRNSPDRRYSWQKDYVDNYILIIPEVLTHKAILRHLDEQEKF